MKTTLTIQKHGNLKTPLYSWSLDNSVGGSFSNSGMHRSLTKCLGDALANGATSDTPIKFQSDNTDDDADALARQLHRARNSVR